MSNRVASCSEPLGGNAADCREVVHQHRREGPRWRRAARHGLHRARQDAARVQGRSQSVLTNAPCSKQALRA
eukprot:1462708-Alexandrium_andersonii.AAC.1